MEDLRDDLKSLICANHDDSKELVTAVREWFSSVLRSVSTAVEKQKKAVPTSGSKKRRTLSDLQSALVLTHNWSKAEVAVHMLDVTKGTDIFPDLTSVAQYSTIVTTILE